jgi:methanogenic corrinoid protein MtbC1
MKPILSTRDLSRIFQVNESSVKRWADMGVLHCFRTPGGHRKFTVEEVLRFAREQKFQLDDDALRMLGVSGRFSRAPGPRELEALGDDLFDALTRQNSDAGSRLLLEALASHLSVETICDSVVNRAVDRVGELCASGAMEVYEERIATAKLTEALVRLSDALGPVPSVPTHALMACVPEEAHDLGLRCARLLLQRHGWKITYLGGLLPPGSVEAAVHRFRPNAVFLSGSIECDGLRAKVESIARATHETGARLVLGGRAFDHAGAAVFPGVDLIVRTVAELEPFVEEISRGSERAG